MSLSKLLLEKYGPEPLSRRIINASAEIRNDPDWAKYLDNKEKRQSWSDMCAERFKTTPHDIDYIFDELEYYKALHENIPHNMVLGGADMVWIKDIPDDDSLTLELKRYADVLEAAYPKKYADWEEGGCILRLIDPLIYPLNYYQTHVLSTPIESSEQALNAKTFGFEPGSFDAWADIVVSLNPNIEVDEKAIFTRNTTAAITTIFFVGCQRIFE
ncbi:hypothetical protein IWW48_002845 [Coemansia sp. RSA 1200]|nr:hypothetical protein IWW48_002845 [Coemansia sp. RSA 1200]